MEMTPPTTPPFDAARSDDIARQLQAMAGAPSLRAMSALFSDAAAQLRAAVYMQRCLEAACDRVDELHRLAAENEKLRASKERLLKIAQELEGAIEERDECFTELRLAREIVDHARWLSSTNFGDHVDCEPFHALLRLYDAHVAAKGDGEAK